MGARRKVARAVLLHVNLLLAMYGGAALVTGSLIYWHGDLSELTLERLIAALALGIGGLALLLLAHTGAVATRRKALLLFALGSWATALGALGAAGWLAWRSTLLHLGGEPTAMSYLCALMFMLIDDEKNQLLFAKKMDKARLELPAGCVVALLVLLLLILVLAGVMALRSRPAHPLATDPTHSVFRRSSSMCYESRVPLPVDPLPPVCRPPPTCRPLFMSPTSIPPPPICYEYPYTP